MPQRPAVARYWIIEPAAGGAYFRPRRQTMSLSCQSRLRLGTPPEFRKRRKIFFPSCGSRSTYQCHAYVTVCTGGSSGPATVVQRSHNDHAMRRQREPPFKNDLVDYVKAGGNLLLIGPHNAALFAAELGVSLEGSVKPSSRIFLAHDGAIVATQGETQLLQLGRDSTPFGVSTVCRRRSKWDHQ